MSTTELQNPLFEHGRAPRFDLITPAHVEPGVAALLEQAEAGLTELEANVAPTWGGSLGAVHRLVEPLAFAWSVVSHLMGVKNSDELRAAYEAAQPGVVTFFTRIGQSRPLFDALQGLKDGPDWDGLHPDQRRAVELQLRDMQLSGVNLEGAASERYQAIQRELAELSTDYSNAVLDSTQAFELVLTQEDEVEGLPPTARAQAAASAAANGHEGATPEDGPWRITLDMPLYAPFVQHAVRRDLREAVYRAYATRASSGEHDNSERIDRILALRKENAALLGYETHAEVSLASKMAPDVASVDELVEQLRAAARPHAERELEELTAFAREQLGDPAFELAPWDVIYWGERVREARYAYTDEELRPYFPLPNVLEGLFALTKRLFGVEVAAVDGELPVWHDDVRAFRISSPAGEELASFYLDPYARSGEKRGGAWMGDFLGRERRPDGTLQLPLATLTCNQTPPVGDTPSLMSHREVETLFHEFGHGLQHMLTTGEVHGVSGIDNVEWDAVELASQFMENWCYHPPTAQGFARHHETGEPLPDDLIEKIIASKNHLAGTYCLRQLMLGAVDFELHHRFTPGGGETPDEAKRRVTDGIVVVPVLAEDRLLHSFGHIFAGGYSAGYYSYKWAEVLSADAFGAFEEAGLDDPDAITETGRRYRDTVLALGSSKPAMDVFTEFRGRAPEIAALLRHSGLA